MNTLLCGDCKSSPTSQTTIPNRTPTLTNKFSRIMPLYKGYNSIVARTLLFGPTLNPNLLFFLLWYLIVHVFSFHFFHYTNDNVEVIMKYDLKYFWWSMLRVSSILALSFFIRNPLALIPITILIVSSVILETHLFKE
jgi:hypothetical protein